MEQQNGAAEQSAANGSTSRPKKKNMHRGHHILEGDGDLRGPAAS
jgi:hypothetical protein